MGEIAEMMIDGFLDWETGEMIDGDAPGYPRTHRRERRKPTPGYVYSLTDMKKGINMYVQNYLTGRGKRGKTSDIVKEYGTFNGWQEKSYDDVCRAIDKNFNHFKTFLLNRKMSKPIKYPL